MKGLVLALCCAALVVAYGSADANDATPPNRPPPVPKPVPVATDNEATTDAPAKPRSIPAQVGRRDDRTRLESLRSALVPSNSFTPPFDEYDESTGERMINSAWTAGGSTDVHENFVRLTNDRQSKVSRKALCCCCACAPPRAACHRPTR